MSLTHKQRLFVEYYIQHWNATKAAELAGYKGNNGTLRAIGSQNLTKINIKEAIQERISEVAMSTDEILMRLTNWGRGDLGDFMNEEGELDVSSEEAKNKTGLISKLKIKEQYADSMKIGTTYDIELHSPMDAVKELAKMKGLYVTKIDHTSSDGTMSPPRTLADIYAEENADSEPES